jgi:Protein of unknown function (DUF5132)
MAFKFENLFEELPENIGVPGIFAGLGAVVLAPIVIPTLVKVGKPIAKAAIKGGIVAYEAAKGVVAEAGEVFEDLVAEAKVELAEDRSQREIESGEANPENG